MHVTDWFPTLLSSAGLTPSSDDLDGIDQWEALLDDATPSPRQEMIYNIAKNGGNTSRDVLNHLTDSGSKENTDASRRLNVSNVSMYFMARSRWDCFRKWIIKNRNVSSC